MILKRGVAEEAEKERILSSAYPLVVPTLANKMSRCRMANLFLL